MRLLTVFGTRPKAIKLAPLLRALDAEPGVESLVCVTGQHRELLDQVLRPFGIAPGLDLDVMAPDQGLSGLVAATLARIDEAMARLRPDRVLVQGDTSTAFAAALAAFHRGVPVAHVEAGLRTGRLDAPFPEEFNRRAVDLIADLLFAPTAGARAALEAEQAGGRIFVTGNTGIDALLEASARLAANPALRAEAERKLPRLDPGRRLVLATGHRRESFGPGLERICAALRRLAERGVEIVYPVHPNPNVRRTVERMLGGCPNLHLVPPLDYLPFVRLMERADLILTDSGGVQEEAPALGTPVLVMRETTERPEAVESGAAQLVGTDPDAILAASERALAGGRGRRASPYGDGKASARIVAALLGRPVDAFAAG